MNSKKCEQCNKELMIDHGDSNIITFCDDNCLNQYMNEYIRDNASDILNDIGDRL